MELLIVVTNKELAGRIDKLEQELQALGELAPNLQQLQELTSTEADIRARSQASLTSASEARTIIDTASTRVTEIGARTTELEASLSRITVALSTVESSSREFITQQQTAFSQAETERSTAFSTILAEKSKELSKTLDELTKKAKDEIATLTRNVSKNRATVEEAKTEVERILGIVGEEALIGEYSKNAARDRRVANVWRWVTAGAIALAVAATTWLAFSATNTSSTWRELLAKVILAVSLSALAGYTARQSSEHRRAQRHSEEMASQLAALKPYLIGLTEPAIADEILSGIAPNFFGRQPEAQESDLPLKFNKKDNPMITGQLLALLSEIIKANLTKIN